jgi:tetratricopeptide (TPR) repeat protein/tRNA A-37 threonylcarbamoyl transferase component Bud32
MGLVYEAVAVDLNRPVALKVLREEMLTRADSCERFRDEAEAVARLAHPNVVQIYEVGVHHGRPFLAMELVSGGTLADRLTTGPLPVAATVELVRDLARAVQHAHDRGVIHRDLKPGNILIAECGMPNADSPPSAPRAAIRDPQSLVPKLTDFGLAKFRDRDRNRTHSGMLLGTPAYMAPEVVAGGPGAASEAADVYGLGAILYECLTACPPADGANTWATLRRVVESDPEPPGRCRPGVSVELDAICLKALAKDPAERYPSARAMAEDLDRFIAGRTVLARNPAYQLRRWWRRVTQRSGRVLAGALVLCAALLLFGALEGRARYRDGVEAERVGRELLGRGAYDEAEPVLVRGLGRVERLPGAGELARNLNRELRQSRRGRRATELHHLVDRLRFEFDADGLAGRDLRAVTDSCDALWLAREAFASDPGAELGAEPERQLRTDLLDLALLSADFRARDRSAPAEARRTALIRLNELGALIGPDPGLARIRAALGRDPGAVRSAPGDQTATAWELYALGRAHLNAGELDPAADLLRRAVDRDQQGFWPHFYLAVCAYKRGRYEDAVAEFSSCLTLARERRGLCYYHRGLAYTALRPDPATRESARADFDRALELEPTLAAAALNRGRLHHEAGRLPDAVIDLERALHNGYAPAVVHSHLAAVALSDKNLTAARMHAARAVEADPTDEKARALLDRLRTNQ